MSEFETWLVQWITDNQYHLFNLLDTIRIGLFMVAVYYGLSLLVKIIKPFFSIR